MAKNTGKISGKVTETTDKKIKGTVKESNKQRPTK